MFIRIFSWNNLFLSWEHPSAKAGNTYNNLSLGHHSFIDIFFSQNIFDCITINRIVDMYDGINPSHHSIILLSFKFIMTFKLALIKTVLLLIAIVCGIRQALKILIIIIMYGTGF